MATYGGTSGNDTLTSGATADTLNGLDGNDVLYGGGGSDSLSGGNGDDTLVGGTGSADTMNGGAGTDLADYSASSAGVTVSLTTGAGSGGHASGDTLIDVENVTGSIYNDSLTGSAADNVLTGGTGNDTLQGGAGADTLDGGTGNDLLSYAASAAGVTVSLTSGSGSGGDAAGDVISGFAHITGSANNDALTGDTAANSLTGGNGNDTLIGGGGADSLYGGGGTDTADYTGSTAAVTVSLATNSGTGGDAAGDLLSSIENLTGSAFNDTLTGDGVANVLTGGDGNDVLLGNAGGDSIYGGAGIDTADYSNTSNSVTINLSSGVAMGGDAAGDVLSGIENLSGSTSGDDLTGDGGANVLTGNAGNDTLKGGGGADSLYGGTGTDTADYSASNDAVTVSLATGTGAGGDAAGDTLATIENLTGSAFDDVLTGDGNANNLTGNAGNDNLYGGAGGDSLFGGDGNDLFVGGSGSDSISGGAGIDTADYTASTAAVNVTLGGTGSGGDAAGDSLTGVENLEGSAYHDTLTGDSGNNSISGGAGNDNINSGAGDDTLEGGAGRDTLYGGSGMDYLDYSDSNAGVNINLATNTASGGHAQGDVLSGVDGAFGSAFDDTLLGFDFAGLSGDIFTNVFYGGGGNDSIDAGGSNDAVYGGSGNDTLIAGSGDDTAAGGAGNDSIIAGTGNDTVSGDAGNDSIDAGDGNDSVDGGTGNDVIAGGLGNDVIDGGEGNDSIDGGAGNDSLVGGDGNDTMVGGAGNDTFVGGAGTDVFYAGVGDTVYGGAGDNDQLIISGSDPYHIFRDPGDPTSGYIEFYDSFGNVIGTLSFSGIDTGVACFTPGTLVTTDNGPRPIESLCPGARVKTRDNGFQPIRWIGRKTFGADALREDASLHPILFRKGALGPNMPNRDMMVSRQHRMLYSSPRAELYFGEDEVFLRALHMAGQPDILHTMVAEVTYLHLMFERHEVIMADGIWSESFQPAARSIGGLDEDQRDELFKVFPDMPQSLHPEAYRSARLTLKAHEARALLAPERLPQRKVA